MTTETRLKCPKEGCTQRVELALDGYGGVDRDFVTCLFHGEQFVGRVPDIDRPDGRISRRGVPMFHGGRL